MRAEGPTINLGSIHAIALLAMPAIIVAGFSGLVFLPAEIPEIAYLLTDPIGLPAFAGTAAILVLVPGLFVGYPFTPRPPPGQPPPSPRWGARLALASLAALSLIALRPVVMRDAKPTREAVALLKKHPIAGKKIGAPVEIGWDVRGELHPSGDVNDVPVPARIDVSVPVRGPRGSGVLYVEGREQGDRWVFDRLWIRLDQGRERVDIVSGPAPTRGAPGAGEGMTHIVIYASIALAVLLVVGLWIASRAWDPARAVASVQASAGAPFTLRFTPRAAKAHRVWLRFEIDYHGGEDDYGVTAELRIELPPLAPFTVEHRIGDRAPALGPKATTSTSLFSVTHASGSEGDSISATSNIATLPKVAPGREIVVSGRVVVAEGQKPVELLVFIVPS